MEVKDFLFPAVFGRDGCFFSIPTEMRVPVPLNFSFRQASLNPGVRAVKKLLPLWPWRSENPSSPPQSFFPPTPYAPPPALSRSAPTGPLTRKSPSSFFFVLPLKQTRGPLPFHSHRLHFHTQPLIPSRRIMPFRPKSRDFSFLSY